MQDTTDVLCELAEMPCSIIIIGIGEANFFDMEILDGDFKRIKNSRGIAATRDIVQFVGFKEAMATGNLAEEVLKEIPDQVSSYMESIDYNPIA